MKAARGRRDPRDRRHGAGARGLQRRQARLRRRARATRPATSSVRPTSPRPLATSSPARRFDNGVLCSSPNSVVVDARHRRGSAPASSRRHGGHFLSAAEGERARKAARHAAAPAQPGARRQVGGRSSPRSWASRCRPGTRALLVELPGRRPRLPAVDREALPGPLLLRRQRLARGLRALQADPALRRHGPHHVDPLAERRRHPRVRPEQARVPHRREHADHARVDRADHGPRPGDDAGVRRLRRQHHVRQHLAAAPAEHQAAGLRHPGGWRSGAGCGLRAGPGRRRPRARRRGPRPPRHSGRRPLPKAPSKPMPEPVSAATLSSRIDQFLASRGVARPGRGPVPSPCPGPPARHDPHRTVARSRRPPRPRSRSSAKTTCGRPCGTARRSSWASAPSSPLPRATPARPPRSSPGRDGVRKGSDRARVDRPEWGVLRCRLPTVGVEWPARAIRRSLACASTAVLLTGCAAGSAQKNVQVQPPVPVEAAAVQTAVVPPPDSATTLICPIRSSLRARPAAS